MSEIRPIDSRFRNRLPDDAPGRWADPTCRHCKPAAPCVMHDRRPQALAADRVIFGPSFGHEPTEADYAEAGELIPRARLDEAFRDA